MWALKYQIDLKEKIIITGIPCGDENTWDSLNFIPGSILRGISISRFLQNHKEENHLQTMRQEFFESDLRFLHAYPEAKNNQLRSLPTPLSWRKFKDASEYENLINLAFNQQDFDDSQLQKIGQPFCFPYQGEYEDDDETDQAKVLFLTPDDWFSLHINKGTEEKMFRYHSLNEGQKFIGYIISSDRAYLEKVRLLFATPEEVFIGRSQKAEYGRVELQFIDELIENWQEVDLTNSLDEFLTLTCLSDVLLRDEQTGAYTSELNTIGIKPERAFKIMTRIGGFNRTVNLPIPQAQAIRAGSVYVYKNSPEVRGILTVWQEHGLGERLHEGYGRVVVDWNNFPELKPDLYSYPQRPIDQRDQFVFNQSTALKPLADLMITDIFHQRVQQRLLKASGQVEITASPSNSQLSRLVAVLQKALDQYQTNADLTQAQLTITTYFNDLKKPALREFDKARIGSTFLKDWILTKVGNPGNIWTDPLSLNTRDYPQIGDQSVDKESLAFSYTLQYILSALRRELKKK